MKGLKLRKLFWLCLIAAALYSGYWLIGARASERGITTWFIERQAQGWHSDHTDVQTRGYPLAFNTSITDLSLADPQTGTAFSTPLFSLESKSFVPTKMTANFATQARASTPYQIIDLTNTTMSGTLDVDAGLTLPLLSTAFELTALEVTSNLGWGFTLADAQLNTLRSEDDRLTHDIVLTATDLAPSAQIMAKMDPKGLLSDKFEVFSINATARFDKLWDITALEGPRPQPTFINVQDLTAKWGELDLRLAGTVDVDAQGIPNGKVQIKAQNWREMIALGIAAGAIPQNLESLLLKGGDLIASLKGNKDTLDAELTLSNGLVSFGFIPLGSAPRLRLR